VNVVDDIKKAVESDILKYIQQAKGYIPRI